MKQEDFLTTPNMVSLGRLGMAPFLFLFLYLEKYLNTDGGTIFYGVAAGAVFLIAALSDILDGYLARKTGQVTDIGKFLDPLADKVMVTTALILLINLDRLPAWIGLIIILREMVITGLRGVASTRGTVIAASNLGKSKTVWQDIAIVCLLLHGSLDFGLGLVPTWLDWLTYHNVGTISMYVAVFYTMYSGYDYIKKFVDSETAAHKKAAENADGNKHQAPS
ncbi:MAG: CDP-diacylglycerol--glycerol-3-phosphate 3-phosphatidyltransferase [Candidatus Lernaella stagnicola]|nr:CDP-diacylglycerol--glycerol-3-phosphate 3-phosphatidyltransferase [Candidatus Lernaella stagnicola]